MFSMISCFLFATVHARDFPLLPAAPSRMARMFSITACLLLATAHARDFPLLPETYSLSVEANLINMSRRKTRSPPS